MRISWSTLTKSKKVGYVVWYALVMSILLVGAVAMIFPLLWQISASLKNSWEILSDKPRLIPKPPRWENYVNAVTLVPFFLYTRNTLIITVIRLLGSMISCSLVGFAFALLRAPGKNVLFSILIGSMMLPGQVTMIPIFVLFAKIHWIDTWYPLTVPAFFAGPYFVFLLRQYFRSLPPELADAVMIDGGGYWTLFSRIVLPTSKAALTVVAVNTFMSSWSDFFGPLLYITTDAKRPLALGIYAMQAVYFGSEETTPLVMAASVLMLIPMLAVFFASQRLLVEGISLEGITGR